MAPEILTGMLLFNAYITEFRSGITDERVFVGVQPGPVDSGITATAWSTCIPESHVFVIHLSEEGARWPKEQLRIVAAHELCHVRLHGEFLCDGKGHGNQHPARVMEIERQATICAAEFLSAVDGKLVK